MVLSALTVRADTTDTEILTPPTEKDSVLFLPSPDQLASVPVIDSVNLEKRLYQSPTIALFKSMLVPGWGQLGNHKYIKALFFIGLESWFIGSVIHYSRDASHWLDLYESTDNIDQKRVYYGLYQVERDDRNKFTWFTAITIFVSMFDAYIDAHLSGSPFDERNRNQDFNFEVYPDEKNGARAVLSFTF